MGKISAVVGGLAVVAGCQVGQAAITYELTNRNATFVGHSERALTVEGVTATLWAAQPVDGVMKSTQNALGIELACGCGGGYGDRIEPGEELRIRFDQAVRFDSITVGYVDIYNGGIGRLLIGPASAPEMPYLHLINTGGLHDIKQYMLMSDEVRISGVWGGFGVMRFTVTPIPEPMGAVWLLGATSLMARRRHQGR